MKGYNWKLYSQQEWTVNIISALWRKEIHSIFAEKHSMAVATYLLKVNEILEWRTQISQKTILCLKRNYACLFFMFYVFVFCFNNNSNEGVSLSIIVRSIGLGWFRLPKKIILFYFLVEKNIFCFFWGKIYFVLISR